MVVFCERCGYLLGQFDDDMVCGCCGYTLIDTKISSHDFYRMTVEEKEEYKKQHLNPEVSTPEYVEMFKKWNGKRIERINKDFTEFERDHPECPYCHTRNTKRISTGSRLLSVGLFGLGSKKIGKQWHCDNCNSDF